MVGARALQMQPGDVLNSTGTTEGILLLNTQPTLDVQARRNKLANGCYSDGEFFTLFASLPVGGYALEWVKKTFRLTDKEISTGTEKSWSSTSNLHGLSSMCRYLFLICGARVRQIKIGTLVACFWSDGFTSSGVSA